MGILHFVQVRLGACDGDRRRAPPFPLDAHRECSIVSNPGAASHPKPKSVMQVYFVARYAALLGVLVDMRVANVVAPIGTCTVSTISSPQVCMALTAYSELVARWLRQCGISEKSTME